MLLQLQLETSVLFLYMKTAAGEGVLDRLPKCFVCPNLYYRLRGSSKIASIMMKDRRERSNLCCPRGRLGIGTKMIVKPPAANGFTDCQHLGRPLWIGDTGEHAICIREVLCQHHRLLVTCGREPDEVVSTINQGRRLPVSGTVPNTLTLNVRV